MGARAVIFDFYGTLAEAVRWGPDLFDVAESLGHQPDRTVQRWWHPERWDGLDHREHSASHDTYRSWERSHRIEVLTEAGLGLDAIDEVLHHWEPEATAYDLQAYPEVPDTLERLRGGGVTVAVCSNWSWELDHALADAALTPLVDVAVTSARAGARKPHPHIYDHTLDQIGCSTHEVVFVGDSWGPDVEGPVAHGMRAAHVWRADDSFRSSRKAPPEPPHPEGVHQIATIDEILGLL